MKELKKKIKIAVSVDTEEDNWAATRDPATVENIRALPRAHDFMIQLGLRPTYFVNYPVVSTDWSAEIIHTLHQTGQCEVGAHLHPWNTPPLEEVFCPKNTMMKNLPAVLQQRKLECLTRALSDLTGESPVSFRAGRFGLDAAGVRALIDLGYQVDSSVTPFVNWTNYSEGSDFSRAPFDRYRIDGKLTLDESVPDGPLWEIPISCGFTRRSFAWRGRMQRVFDSPRIRPFRLAALASRTGIVRRVVGSPETDGLEDLLRLARSLIESDVGYLHLFFHSPSLVPGNSPFVRTREDAEALLGCLSSFVTRISDFVDLEPATVREVAGVGG